MKSYSLDEWWERLKLEREATGRSLTWIDRAFYRLALDWLRWRCRCP
jgi:hypothetical protein